MQTWPPGCGLTRLFDNATVFQSGHSTLIPPAKTRHAILHPWELWRSLAILSSSRCIVLSCLIHISLVTHDTHFCILCGFLVSLEAKWFHLCPSQRCLGFSSSCVSTCVSGGFGCWCEGRNRRKVVLDRGRYGHSAGGQHARQETKEHGGHDLESSGGH